MARKKGQEKLELLGDMEVDLSLTRPVPIVKPETVTAGRQEKLTSRPREYFGSGGTHQVAINPFVGNQPRAQSPSLPLVAKNLVSILTAYLSDCAVNSERKGFEYKVNPIREYEYGFVQTCEIFIRDIEAGTREEFGTLTINAYDSDLMFVSSMRYHGRRPIYGSSQDLIELISTDCPVLHTNRTTREEGIRDHADVLWRHDLDMGIETFAVGEIAGSRREAKLEERRLIGKVNS